MTGVTFDAQLYKETTREQWQEAADASHRWDPFFEEWLGGATREMLDRARVTRPRRSRARWPLSAAECTRLERESCGALHQMLAGLSPAEHDEAWAEVEDALLEFEGPDGFTGPCELLVGAGTA